MSVRSLPAAAAAGLALLMTLLVAACDVGSGRPAPRARAGVVDLTGWDFARLGPVELDGEWGFTWGDDPTRAFTGRAGDFILQPGAWNDTPGTMRSRAGTGRATLSLKVLLPADAPQLALVVPVVNSAYRLHLNGRPELSMGKVADGDDPEIPVYRPALVHVEAGATVLSIVMEVSNHHHFEGGMTRAIVLGDHDDLSARAERRMVVPLVALGALAVVFLLQVTFFVGGRRERAFAIFAAFTALIAVRTFATGHLYALADTPLRGDVWYLLPSYVSLFVFPGIYLAFLRELFPAEVSRRLLLPVAAVSAAGVAAAVILPSEVYTWLRDPFRVLLLAMPVVGTGILALAVWRRRVGAGWMLAGSSAFLATVVNDSLRHQRVLDTADLSSLGFAAFAVAYSLALALRTFRSEHDASQRLEQANRALEERVHERTRSLAEAKAAAERASRARSEFLAVMSHEIRTPIHGWAGLTELLAQTPLTEQQRAYVGLLRRTADDLGLLLGDILDMARIETGRFTVERVPFDLSRLIDDLGELGRESARARGLAFDLVVGPGVPVTALGDAEVVRRIVANFLDNAAKFTERGDVGLEVALAGADSIRFSVSDTGCGIPPERRGELFTAFCQMDSSSRRRHGGSGLGLALCRRLAELAGGGVGVDSTPGVGSTFWCELPLPAAAPVEAPPRDRPSRAIPAGLRVLVADDVALNRLVLRGFLAAAGCEVDEAADGAEAIAMAEQTRYGLIVLDLRMPGTDGFSAARAIRASERGLGLPPVPMAALSAGAASEDRRMALDAGFDVFLGKPIERDELLAELARLLPEADAAAPPPPPVPPAGLEHLMPLFVTEMDKDARHLDAIRAGDRAELAEFSHAMRGKAAMFGEEILYDLLTRLEMEAAGAPGEEIDEIVAQVIERAGQLRVYDAGSQPVPS